MQCHTPGVLVIALTFSVLFSDVGCWYVLFCELMQFILMIYILDYNVYITDKMEVRMGISTATLCTAKELRVQVSYL